MAEISLLPLILQYFKLLSTIRACSYSSHTHELQRQLSLNCTHLLAQKNTTWNISWPSTFPLHIVKNGHMITFGWDFDSRHSQIMCIGTLVNLLNEIQKNWILMISNMHALFKDIKEKQQDHATGVKDSMKLKKHFFCFNFAFVM